MPPNLITLCIQDAVATESPDPFANPRGADPGVPFMASGAARLCDYVRSLLRGRYYRLFRWLPGARPGTHFASRPVPRPNSRQDHGWGSARHADLEPQSQSAP